MLRLTAYVATLAVAAATAFAADLSDTSNTFHLKAPDGWNVEPPSVQLALALTSPRKAETGGNCTIVTATDGTSKTTSQAEFDDFLATQINEGFWKAVIGGTGGLQSASVEGGAKQRRGRQVFYAKVTSTFATADGPLAVTQRMDVQGIPGRLFVVTCTARKSGFDREAADFETILESLEPQPFVPARKQSLGPTPKITSVVGAALNASVTRARR